MELSALETAIGIVITGGGAIYAAYVKVLRPMFRTLRTNYAALQKVPDLAESIQRLGTELHDVRKEFNSNGGSSLRDVLDRIDGQMHIQSQITRATLATQQYGSFTASAGGAILDPGRMFCSMLNRSESELKGNNWITCVHEDERDDIRDEWRNAVTDGRDFDQMVTFIMGKGQGLRVHMKWYPMTDRFGKLTGFFGTLTPSPESTATV